MAKPKTELEALLNDKIQDYNLISKNAWKKDINEWKTIDSLAWIRIGIASKTDIHANSFGEVLISETINYRTQKPERWGLFCEQIFWPRKNFECACWKYKRIRYKWIVCDRCWVEVTSSQVRRQRMWHIDLAAPVAHIWYMKSIPSRIGLFLDIPVKKLEQVIYFASYIITDLDKEKQSEAIRELNDRYKVSKIELQKEAQKIVQEAKNKLELKEIKKKEYQNIEAWASSKLDQLDEEFNWLIELLENIEVWQVIWELDFRTLYSKFPHVFKWWTWAEHIRVLLERIDLWDFIKQNKLELSIAPKSRQKKLLQKLKIATNLFKSNQRPEWFILESIQVIPPDLRPMIQLDGWRFASSDLNDLYRRVINRNNRLRKLIELWAPEVILKNEKRMLQESVDMLFTGESRWNRSGYITATNKKLKSLTEVLKGKQWRFRQNLLWKRVDYSGRSVIIVWPTLNIDECGLPKTMAVVLFKPFIIWRLIELELAFNIKWAEKLIDEWNKDIWDALDYVLKWKYVILNRAPTLHRLWIQAFRPVLIEGKAIQLHPLTCAAFNADFDWDQMAVHLPLSERSQKEAKDLMVTSKNILNPSSWEPIVLPSQDMLLGSYYLTRQDDYEDEKLLRFYNNIEDLELAYSANIIWLHTPIRFKLDSEFIVTTYWRIKFNEIIPNELWFINKTVWNKRIKALLARAFDLLWSEETAFFANRIKDIWYKYSTISWISISKDDMIVPDDKQDLIEKGEELIRQIQNSWWNWFMTEEERYTQTIWVWSDIKKTIEIKLKENFTVKNHLFNMVDSWARWNWWQLTQLCWTKWLVASPSGKTIELPIKSNLKEWFTTLEYFIATHGWRKWKADTALKTAQSWYMTRRLVDSAQNILIREEDCNTIHYETINKETSSDIFKEDFNTKIFWKTLAKDIIDLETWEIILEEWVIITKKELAIILEKNITELSTRSVLTCETANWVCQKCYWLDLGSMQEVKLWSPVWIVAAQSIWEPGTQLTMRTFHSWWVAKEWWDITQGLTRVEELLEARAPKTEAIISDFDWVIKDIIHKEQYIEVVLLADSLHTVEQCIDNNTFNYTIKTWDVIKQKQIIARSKRWKWRINAIAWGLVEKIENWIIYIKDQEKKEITYKIWLNKTLLVKVGDLIKAWDKLIEWHINLQKLMSVASVLTAELYVVNDIKWIYTAQWQTVNSKHIEIIVRQMFSKIKIIDAWTTKFFPGDIVDVIEFQKENRKISGENEKQALGQRLLLWLTKTSLHTDSWLSAASFQETVRVLVEASVSKRVDKLEWLKENVIIWRLIPTLKYFNNNIETSIKE